jgi:hypothetical protein
MPRRNGPGTVRIALGALLVGAVLFLAVDQRWRLTPPDCVRVAGWDRVRVLGGRTAQTLGRFPRRDCDLEEVRAYLRRYAFWEEGPGADGVDLLYVRR